MTNYSVVGDLYTRCNNNTLGAFPQKIEKEKIKNLISKIIMMTYVTKCHRYNK
jgi:hypothetical protein